ncbi:MAG: hypothetical protein JWO80_4311 [Bryobacterales bacterium]|nr:hypothetical protein [Bryobacterales bacterium]
MFLSRILGIAALLVLVSLTASAETVLTGRVVDEHGSPVAQARVWVNDREAYTTPAGDFRLPLAAGGPFLVSVEHVGFFLLKDQPVDTESEITLVLNPQREVFQSVVVGEAPSPVDPSNTSREQRLSGTEINNVPYPASHSLRNSLKLMPGVIQDPSGAVHFHGGAEYQTQYLLDGFDISDPIGGRFTTPLAVEGVRSVDLISGRESPQYGRGSAGTLAVNPENGTDVFHFTATNFIPGLSTRRGVRPGNWTPRAGFSGPLIKGRAWFSDSLDGQYNKGYINGLPKGQDANSSWLAANLLHAQVNLTPANILYGDFLTSFQKRNHFGLGVLDPVETTTRRRSDEWVAGLKDAHTWTNGTLLEIGFAWQTVFYRAIPQGDAPYVLSPTGRSGNYFVASSEHGGRRQLFANLFAPVLHFHGQHQLQFGADVQRLEYSAVSVRTQFRVIGLAGLPLFDTSFSGVGHLNRPNASVASYFNDHWQPFEKVSVDLGVRDDWDELVRQAALAPRVAFSYAPFTNGRTKFTAGYAMIHDATNLSLFSRPMQPQAITTPYSTDGAIGTPLVTTFVTGRGLVMPRYDNWSAGAEHDFGRGISAKLELLRKRGRDGFVYAPVAGPGAINIQPQALGYGFGGKYALSNVRRDAYDEAAITVRQSLGGQYEWFVSYVRSRAVSNAVLDVSIDQPLQAAGNFGPMPWDSPNRILSWGYLPFGKWLGPNWAFAYLADMRTGFPFSITTDGGTVSGPVDSHRFPVNFDLNLHVERRFTFRGYRFAVRGGINNVTDSRNPTAVNNVIGAPQFMQFYGTEGRHLEFRLRFFGKKGV